MVQCPVCGMMVDEGTAPRSEYMGKTYYFHKPAHKEMFDKDPGSYTKAGASRPSMGGMSDMNQ